MGAVMSRLTRAPVGRLLILWALVKIYKALQRRKRERALQARADRCRAERDERRAAWVAGDAARSPVSAVAAAQVPHMTASALARALKEGRFTAVDARRRKKQSQNLWKPVHCVWLASRSRRSFPHYYHCRIINRGIHGTACVFMWLASRSRRSFLSCCVGGR